MQIKTVLIVGIICMFFGTSATGIVTLKENVTANTACTSVTYSFNEPIMGKLTTGEHTYDTVVMPGSPCTGEYGSPTLPTQGAYILLPQKTRADTIVAIHGDKVLLGSGYKVIPTGNPTPSSHDDTSQVPLQNEEIYQSEEPFPGKLFTEVGTYSFRGYEILVLMLHPVQYVPSTGELFYYKEMKISVHTVQEEHINPLFRGLDKDKVEALKKIDNPPIAETYHENTYKSVSSSEYDLLIITKDSLKRDFKTLEDYHTSKGVRTVIKTLEETGNTADDIRDFIRSAYLDLGIDYVLIGGDNNIVPAKMLWVFGLDEDTWPYETIMPSDLYYSCLDGTFNYDGDNKWGEPTDGENGEDVDLLAEVYVGRACVGDKDEVNNFVTKTIAYIDADESDEFLKKVCLAGEHLGDYGVASWGGNHLDQLIETSDADGYVTAGIPPNEYVITKLYDRDWTDHYWPKSEIINTINEGTHLIIHDGHSNYGYALKMVSDDTKSFTNTKYCFIYSSGCNAGGFDEGDCIAEYFTVKTECGAFAAIMNARYGWFWSYRTDGDSQRYKREFWDAVIGENTPVISKANQDSKEDNLFLIERSMMRWVYYQLNYFGDPTLALHVGSSPDKPITPSGTSRVEEGITYTYSTSTTDKDGEQVYYKWDWGDGSMSDWIGPYRSGETMNASHAWAEKGVYTIRVKAKDTSGVESEWSDPLRISVPKKLWLTHTFLHDIISVFKIIITSLYSYYVHV